MSKTTLLDQLKEIDDWYESQKRLVLENPYFTKKVSWTMRLFGATKSQTDILLLKLGKYRDSRREAVVDKFVDDKKEGDK